VTWAKDKWGETPVRALDKLGIFSVPTIAAHCVHVTEEEIHILADRKITAVHCPKSNAKLGNGHAPVVSLLGNEDGFLTAEDTIRGPDGPVSAGGHYDGYVQWSRCARHGST